MIQLHSYTWRAEDSDDEKMSPINNIMAGADNIKSTVFLVPIFLGLQVTNNIYLVFLLSNNIGQCVL